MEKSRALSRVIVLGLICTLCVAGGCAGAPNGDAIAGAPVEGQPLHEVHGTSDVEAVPILSIIGQPLIELLLPSPSALPASASSPAPVPERMVSVLAGTDIWFEFNPKRASGKWYRCFRIELVGFTTRTGPTLTKGDILVMSPSSSWVWEECAAPPFGNMASSRVIQLPTKMQSAAGSYLAVFKITPYFPVNGQKKMAEPLELVGVVIVQP